jgi:hypothetical protein
VDDVDPAVLRRSEYEAGATLHSSPPGTAGSISSLVASRRRLPPISRRTINQGQTLKLAFACKVVSPLFFALCGQTLEKFPLAGDEFRLLFQRKEVCRPIHNNDWWFVIVDVVAALTASADPQGYVKDMRRRDPEYAKGWGQIASPLSISTVGCPQITGCTAPSKQFVRVSKRPLLIEIQNGFVVD